MPTLNWIGKDAVVRHHAEVPFRLLEEVPELSCPDPAGDSENLIVQGDNLEALKALLPRYAGQVKCIYIDPPYNTGNEGWIYNDAVNSPEIRQWLGKTVGKEAEDLSRHDKWLCMMYPRLVLLRQFLREDGAIFISIDDNEVASLRLLMDEIFGRHRFIATCVWQKRYSRENRGAIGDVHEYLLVYATDFERFKQVRNLVPLNPDQTALYKNPNNDSRGPWQSVSMTAQGWRPNQMYEIIAPNGKRHLPPEGRCWAMTEPEFAKYRAADKIYFGKSGDGVPRIMQFLSESEGLVPWTWWPHDDVGHTDESRKEVQSIFGTQTAFDTPKPTRLIQRILQIATNPGDLVLDSFAGSGTTGHAVLALNKQDGGNRRFILCEIDETIAAGITRERVARVARGYTNAKGEAVAGLGGGFQFARLGKTLFDEAGMIRSDVKFGELAEFVFFRETGRPLPKAGRGKRTPLLGTHDGRAVYLLFNGILGDRSVDGGNVLTGPVLSDLPPHDGPKVIYAAACRMGRARLEKEQITFKQTPYDLQVP